MAVWQEWAQEQSRDRRGLWGSGQGLEMGVLQGQGWEPPAGQGGRSSMMDCHPWGEGFSLAFIIFRSCLASQDPYCGWHSSRGCVDIRGGG